MKTFLTTIGVLIVGAGLGFGLFLYTDSVQAPQAGANFTTSVTDTVVTISTATTSIYADSANLRYVRITNLGAGRVSCAFGSDLPVLKSGLIINPVGSSTLTAVEIIDPNLLMKRMVCIADANTSSSILKY